MSSHRALSLGLAASVSLLALAGCGNDRWLLDSGTRDVANDFGCSACGDAADVRDASDVAPLTDVLDVVDAIDSGSDAIDTLIVDSPPDAPDVVRVDATDAPDVVDVPMVDAGPSARCTPAIDGTLGADWTSDALIATNSTASTWGTGLNELHSIRVCYDATSLYLGIDGIVESGNAMVAYIDRDYDPPGGAPTGVSLFSALTDSTGALDDAISADFTLGAGAGNYGAEAAWGSLGMASVAASTTDASAGLRLIAPAGPTGPDRRADFAWTMGSQTACSSTNQFCETSIAWTSLFEGPRPTSGRIALFVRINNGLGTMSSNQTLPEDMPAMSRTVSRVLVLSYGP